MKGLGLSPPYSGGHIVRQRLACQQVALAGDFPPIAGRRAVARDNPVAGYPSASVLAAHARHGTGTLGEPRRVASALYEIVLPAGMRCSAFHTRCWKAVPRRSSGSASPPAATR